MNPTIGNVGTVSASTPGPAGDVLEVPAPTVRYWRRPRGDDCTPYWRRVGNGPYEMWLWGDKWITAAFQHAIGLIPCDANGNPLEVGK